jgi:hypothetical protein
MNFWWEGLPGQWQTLPMRGRMLRRQPDPVPGAAKQCPELGRATTNHRSHVLASHGRFSQLADICLSGTIRWSGERHERFRAKSLETGGFLSASS